MRFYEASGIVSAMGLTDAPDFAGARFLLDRPRGIEGPLGRQLEVLAFGTTARLLFEAGREQVAGRGAPARFVGYLMETQQQDGAVGVVLIAHAATIGGREVPDAGSYLQDLFHCH